MKYFILIVLLTIGCGSSGGGDSYQYDSYVYDDIPEVTWMAAYSVDRYPRLEVFEAGKTFNLELNYYDYFKNISLLIVEITNEEEVIYNYQVKIKQMTHYNHTYTLEPAILLDEKYLGENEVCSYVVDSNGIESEDECLKIYVN